MSSEPLVDAILVLVLLLNLVALGGSRIVFVIRTVALQGFLLGCLPLLLGHEITGRLMLVAGLTILVKSTVIPRILEHAMASARIRREVEPLIGLLPSLMLCAAGTMLAISLGERLPLHPNHAHNLIVPASIATLLSGFLIITTRVKAITQVLGYLVLENGVFIFGLLLLEVMPFLVEIGVLLDLLVGVFVLTIILHQINREFSSQDTLQMAQLKE